MELNVEPPMHPIFADLHAMRPLRVLLPVLLLACSLTAGAQKYAYVDTEYILQHLPEYADAQKSGGRSFNSMGKSTSIADVTVNGA